MKKIMILMILTVSLLISACSDKTKENQLSQVTYQLDSPEVTTTIELVSTSTDILKEISTKNTYRYDQMGLTKEELEAYMTPMSEQYKQLEGVSETMKYEESEAVETLKINLDQLDESSFASLSVTKNMTLDDKVKELEAAGFNKKE